MQGCGQKHQKCPKNGVFPICDPPRIFFTNRALSLLYPYGTLTSYKKLQKTNVRSLRYLKADQRTDGQTDKGDYYGPPPLTQGPKYHCARINSTFSDLPYVYLCTYMTTMHQKHTLENSFWPMLCNQLMLFLLDKKEARFVEDSSSTINFPYSPEDKKL